VRAPTNPLALTLMSCVFLARNRPRMKSERNVIPAELLHDFVANVDRPEQSGADWRPARQDGKLAAEIEAFTKACDFSVFERTGVPPRGRGARGGSAANSVRTGK
jgi:hypothetical protein